MKNLSPILKTDFYKVIHEKSYEEGLEYLVSYWTPRKSRLDSIVEEGLIDEVVNFGLQAVLITMQDEFQKDFFNRDLQEVLIEYERYTGLTEVEHIKKLHNLGYLPLQVREIDEGVKVPIKVPMFEIKNTISGFGWLVNYLETYISCRIWQPMTSATIAHEYRKLVNIYYNKTVDKDERDPKTACGDFSMRGMSSQDSAMASGAGHLLSFTGTATIPAIYWLEKMYHANVDKEIVGVGTPSTEHSVMSSYGKDGEFRSYEELLKRFPTGPLSIVSDTYDYWNVLTNYLPLLKETIEERDGKVIIRGDSGDPVDIITGEIDYTNIDHLNKKVITPADKGTIEILWDIFGGYINKKGYKVLNPKIGAIYGDSITPARAKDIYKRLEAKGFSVSNVTLGIGSYTFQYNTRDTFGFALKATHSIINGEERQIFKEPKTDTGNFKKSQKGMCHVFIKNNEIRYIDGLSMKEQKDLENKEGTLFNTIFLNGEIKKPYCLGDIRERLNK